MIQRYYFRFRAMSCDVEAALETEADGEPLLAALPAQFEVIEALLSRFRPESELSRLNEHAGEWTQVSEVLFANLVVARQAALLTDGLYNPLILPALIASGYDRSFQDLGRGEIRPGTHSAIGDWRQIKFNRGAGSVLLPAGSAVDLGGIAKGWTAALIADQLRSFGPCLISIGGDIALRGAPAGQPGWEINIVNSSMGQSTCRILLSNTSVVTSGIDYRRWQTIDGHVRHHIIDPRTGESAETDVQTVTIIHPHAPTAEAYAKAVVLLGCYDGLAWLNQQWDAAGLVVSRDGTVLATSNWLNIVERSPR